MSDLSTFRDHARAMSTAEHKPDCAQCCDCRASWCCGCNGHPIAKPWGWAYMRWKEHDATCPSSRCPGCVTDADRALWMRLADEVDAYLTTDEEGLFA